VTEATSIPSSFIAVVDDDLRILESLESLLEAAGYIAAVFPSAEAFLQSSVMETASCLITDVRMPSINGLDLQWRMKSLRPDLPIIFMTAHNDDEAERRAIGEGAAGFLHKTFSASDFLVAVRRALGELTEEQ